MAPLTYKGLRKPGDPRYRTTTIVIGPLVRRPATSTAQEPRPQNAPGKPTEPGRESKNDPQTPNPKTRRNPS